MVGKADREALLDRLLLKESILAFYNRESRLLDSRKYAEWVENFTDDATYTIPLQRNMRFDRLKAAETRPGKLDTAWFSDTKETLAQRVEQLETGVHWAEEPASRIVHVISNVEIQDISVKDTARVASVLSCFVVYRNRGDQEVDFFVGRREDKLREEGERWRIADRLVFLGQSVLLAKNLTLFF